MTEPLFLADLDGPVVLQERMQHRARDGDERSPAAHPWRPLLDQLVDDFAHDRLLSWQLDNAVTSAPVSSPGATQQTADDLARVPAHEGRNGVPDGEGGERTWA